MNELPRVVKRKINHLLGSVLGYEIRRRDKSFENRYVWLRSMGIRTVIDIGANEGQFARIALDLFPGAKLCCFEPLADCCKILAELGREHKGITVFPYACGETSDEVSMNRSSFSPSSSLLEMGSRHKELYPFSSDSSQELVSVRRLDDLVGDIPFERPILIKVDVQGFENRVIRGGVNTFATASVVIIEVSFETLYKEQASFDSVYQLLVSTGFHFRGLAQQDADPNTGIPIYADAYFLRG